MSEIKTGNIDTFAEFIKTHPIRYSFWCSINETYQTLLFTSFQDYFNRASPWRKIESEDDLPKENNKEYLITTNLGFVDVMLMSDGEFWADKKIYTQDIVAWMPLPEPFEEK